MNRRALRLAVACGVALVVALGMLVRVRSNYVRSELRKQDRAIREDRWDEYREEKTADHRHVDIGVELCCVVQDNSLLGQELLSGKPRLRIVKSIKLGGILDRKKRRIVGPSASSRRWFCSEDQWPLILHGDDLPLGLVVYGSEGAGKTVALAMWHYCRWLEHLGEGREGGQTAPTRDRLAAVLAEIQKLWAPEWYKLRKSEGLLVLCDGMKARQSTKIRLRATKKQSKEQGSPVQTYTWSWGGRDELQDQIDAHEDVEARLRGARDGRPKQLATCTAKDHSAWRAFRDQLLAIVDGKVDWVRKTLLGLRSPFVAREFWATKERRMSKREYRRRVLAEDLPPQLAVYYAWDRDGSRDRMGNLVRVPQLGAPDVTAAVLADYTSYSRPARFTLLAGHDPGAIYNTTVFLRCLMFPGRAAGDPPIPTWVIVGEVRTEQTTQREHARQVRAYVQERFGIEKGPSSSKVLVFCDPHGRGESKTDYKAVYMAFQREGLDVFSPAPMTGVIFRAPRIELMNRLLGDSHDDVVRLVVAKDELGQPAAPEFVSAVESLEKRPGDDNPEGEHKKNENDRTHAPAACAYALWPFEEEDMTDITVGRARAEARRIQIA